MIAVLLAMFLRLLLPALAPGVPVPPAPPAVVVHHAPAAPRPTPRPVPVAPSAPVAPPAAPLDPERCGPDEDWDGVDCIHRQNPDEVIGRAITCTDGSDGYVIDEKLDTDCP